MTLKEMCKDRSCHCTDCGAKGRMKAVGRVSDKAYEGPIKCLECGKKWYAVVPQYQRP